MKTPTARSADGHKRNRFQGNYSKFNRVRIRDLDHARQHAAQHVPDEKVIKHLRAGIEEFRRMLEAKYQRSR